MKDSAKYSVVGAAALAAAGLLIYKTKGGKTEEPTAPPKLYFHVKHTSSYPYTLGKIQEIYSTIKEYNNTGLNVGLEPQCSAEWPTQLQYLQECGDIPVMLNVLTSDDAVQLTIDQLTQALTVCNVKYLRFHEALSYFDPFPMDYVYTILDFSKSNNIPIFWNEWNIYNFDMIADIIKGYEQYVLVSFGTNGTFQTQSGTYLEPAEIFQTYLSPFLRKGASVQSWYWWERNGRVNGYELTMPPSLMRLHTADAFNAHCEIVQLEPFNYFFQNQYPVSSLLEYLTAPF